MRRVRVHKGGGFDRLKIENFELGPPAAHEVRIEVRAVGVNFADSVVRMGLYDSAKKLVGWPITPGFEVSGVVVDVGAAVTRVQRGDEVIGLTQFGGYASHVQVPETQVFRKPADLSFVQAATVSVVYLTAYYALHELARPRANGKLLVHSAAGGVGGALLQMAKQAGHLTLGVVGSQAKVEVARSLGATLVVDKSTTPLWPAARAFTPDGFDAVFDANGPTTLRQSYEHLRPTGRLVIYGFHSLMPGGPKAHGGTPNWPKMAAMYLRTPRFDPYRLTNDNKSVMGFNLSYLFGEAELLGRAMDDILGKLNAGALTPLPVHSYPLDDVAEAQRAIESGTTSGKLALVP
jgi:NADPH:quinone reductase-like Zn-dependent oxidoreductase